MSCTSSRHITKLKQSVFAPFDIYGLFRRTCIQYPEIENQKHFIWNFAHQTPMQENKYLKLPQISNFKQSFKNKKTLNRDYKFDKHLSQSNKCFLFIISCLTVLIVLNSIQFSTAAFTGVPWHILCLYEQPLKLF